MKYVGAHVSTVGGVENAPVNAHGIGAKAFALFTQPEAMEVATAKGGQYRFVQGTL